MLRVRTVRRAVVVAMLSSAVIAGLGLAGPGGSSRLAFGQAAGGAPVGAAAPAADQQTAVPVKQVVLYSSGVGYFEHFGSVKGNSSTELRFKAAQINDILKSLVLQDLDKGRVGVITYPSQDPVAKTLRSFQIDITANPSLAELLNQLRGAKVTITVGDSKVSGTVLGVEKKQRPMGSGSDTKVVEVPYLNLIADGGAIRSVSLEEVKGLELLDKKLQEELNRALAALAGARDQDKKPVTINLAGEGERRVRIGYVVETPVWKTSYRLMLSDKVAGDKGSGDKGAGDKGAEKKVDGGAGEKPAGGNTGGDLTGGPPNLGGGNAPNLGGAKPDVVGAATKPAGSGSLQGWAIVENQTDNDWQDVQLSLVSGRPISFIQDLYQPLYVPRPVVQPELYASLRPQTYDAGIGKAVAQVEFGSVPADRGGAIDEKRQSDLSLARRAGRPGQSAAPAGGSGGGGAGLGMLADKSESLAASIDPSASVASIASATKVGELFQYTVGSVTLPRQTSAMIPVVTDSVEVEKLSIYNMNVLPKNPLLGARVKNTTGKHLLQGPITVLDGGTYAGDARIDDVPPGQERLVSYGVDQQVLVQAQNNKQENVIQTGKVVKGVLQLTRKLVAQQEYVAENKGDKDRTLIVEHARRGGWKLAEPAKADETTDALYRFKGGVASGKGTKLMVREELVTLERIILLNLDDNMLAMYIRAGELPQEVREALVRAAGLRQELAGTQRQIQERRDRINVITQEQNRLRDNMKAVAQNTDYYQRLLKKLDEQESTIEGVQKEITGLEKTSEQQRKALEDYVNGLNVG